MRIELNSSEITRVLLIVAVLGVIVSTSRVASADSLIETVTPDVMSSTISWFNSGNDIDAGTYVIRYVKGAMKYNGSYDWSVHDQRHLPCRYRVRHSDTGTGTDVVAPAEDPGVEYSTIAAVEAANSGKFITINHTGGKIGVWLDDNPYTDNVKGSANGGSDPTFALIKVGAPIPGGGDSGTETGIYPFKPVCFPCLFSCLMPETGNDHGTSPFGPGGIRSGSGGLQYNISDLSSNGQSEVVGVTRTFNSRLSMPVLGPLGWNWQMVECPRIVPTIAQNKEALAIDLGGAGSLWFDCNDLTTMLNPTRGVTMSHDATNDHYLLTVVSGGQQIQIKFHDFDQTDDPQGAVKEVIAPNGKVASYTYDKFDRIETIERAEGSGASTVLDRVEFDYIDGMGADADQIEYATLRRSTDDGSNWTEIRRTKYSYYIDTDTYGSENDLKKVTEQIPDTTGPDYWDNATDVRTTFYRYETAAGSEHRLKFVFGPEAYRRLTDTGNPGETGSDGDVDDYADMEYAYDTDGRVTTAKASGGGGGCCGGSGASIVIAYSSNTSYPSSPTDVNNTWLYKTVTETKDGSNTTLQKETVYTNAYGQVMLKVIEGPDDLLRKRAWFYRYAEDGDAGEGQVIWEAGPDVVDLPLVGMTTDVDYSELESHDDLLDETSGDYAYLDDSNGEIRVTEYAGSTTATTATAGNVDDYVKATKVREGNNGTDDTLVEYKYIKHTADSVDVYPIAEIKQWVDCTTHSNTTKMTYTWHAGVNVIEQKTTERFVVENSTAAADELEAIEVFDEFGQMTWRTDENGFISYNEFDARGRRIKQIEDVDTTETGDFTNLPTGWSSPSNGGLHMITEFEFDEDGRQIKRTGPTHVISINREGIDPSATQVRGIQWTVYKENDASSDDETWTTSGYISGPSTPQLGGVSITKTDKAGRTVASILSERDTGETGELEDDEDYSDQTLWHSYSTRIYSDDSLLTNTRRYHTIPASGTGAEGTNYDETDYEYDDLDRLVKVIDPAGKNTYTVYTVHTSGGVDHGATLTYPHNKDSGSIRITWVDDEGMTVRSWTASSTANWTVSGPDEDTLDIDAGSPDWTEETRTATAYDYRNRVETVRRYHDLTGLSLSAAGTKDDDYYETEYLAYDELDRALRIEDGMGNISATVYDGIGRVKSSWMGTDATGATRTDPDGSGGNNNMIKVSESFYDLDKDDTGTRVTYATRVLSIKPIATLAGNSTDYTYTDFEPLEKESNILLGYTWRVSWTKPEVGAWTKLATNKAGRTIETTIFENGAPPTSVLSQTTATYDVIDRPRASRVHEDNGSGALTGKYIESTTEYDDVGRAVKRTRATGGFTKTEFDDAGRVVRSVFASAEGTDTDPDDFNDDIVLTETILTYDDAGNVVITKTHNRNHDAGATGGLLSSNLTKARTTTAMTWYDDAHRPTHQVDHGTNTPHADYDDPETDTAPEPNTSDDYLVTKIEYDAPGRQYQTTDNKGIKTRREFDDLGRTTKLIENYIDGAPADSDPDGDRVTTYAYNADNQITEQTADLENTTNDQKTTYVYSIDLTDKGSPVKSNSYLRAIIMPDSDDTVASSALDDGTDTTYDRVEMTYHANGQLATRKDQRAITLTHTYDAIGRRTEQEVTAGTVDGDQQVKYAYTDLSQIESITAYSVADTTVNNEVEYKYNGYRQIETEYQEHGGAVNTGTSHKIQYAYDTTLSTNLHTKGHRLKTTTYPNDRIVHTVYDGHSGVDDAISRPNKISEDNAGSPGNAIVNYDLLGSGATVVKTYPTDTGMHSGDTVRLDRFGGTADAYTGFDAFGRPIDHRWVEYTDAEDDNVFSDADLWYAKHGYDRASNRLNSKRQIYTAHARLYDHDGLHRLIEDHRGPLNDAEDGIAGITFRKQVWALDALGNPTKVQDSWDPSYVTNASNDANELTAHNVTGNLDRPHFQDDFDDASNPKEWEAIQGGFDIDTSTNNQMHITSVDGTTGHAIILLDGDHGTLSSRLATTTFPGSTGKAGLVFGYKSANDYWLYVEDEASGKREFFHVINGNLGSALASSNGIAHIMLGRNEASQSQLGYSFAGNGFPSGRVGLFSDTVGVTFSNLGLHEHTSVEMTGRWINHGPNIYIDSDDDDLYLNQWGVTGFKPVLLRGLRMGGSDGFEVTFSMIHEGSYGSAYLVFNATSAEDYDAVSVTGIEVIEGWNPGTISPASTSTWPTRGAGELYWLRVTYDVSGTDPKIEVHVLASATEPTSWSGATLVWEEDVSGDPFDHVGGMLGFKVRAGVSHVDDVKIKSDRDGDGTYETTEHIERFTVDANDRSDDEPEHDASGNLTYDGVNEYVYDAWNRLVEVRKAYKDGGSVQTGSTTATYEYDGLGRLIVREITNSAQLDCTYDDYYDGQRVIEIRCGSDDVLKQYVWGLEYIDELVQIGINDDPTDGTEDDVESFYYALHNANYNVQLLIDDEGVIVERYEYAPYGERTVYISPGTNDPDAHAPTLLPTRVQVSGADQPYGICDVGFQGKRHSDVTGLIAQGERWLHPRFGNFTTRDRLGYPDGTNGYAAYFVLYGGLDPSGLKVSIDGEFAYAFRLWEGGKATGKEVFSDKIALNPDVPTTAQFGTIAVPGPVPVAGWQAWAFDAVVMCKGLKVGTDRQCNKDRTLCFKIELTHSTQDFEVYRWLGIRGWDLVVARRNTLVKGTFTNCTGTNPIFLDRGRYRSEYKVGREARIKSTKWEFKFEVPGPNLGTRTLGWMEATAYCEIPAAPVPGAGVPGKQYRKSPCKK